MDLEIIPGAEGLWTDLLHAKYMGRRDLYSSEVPAHGSQF
jgi:hypothetical protein